MHIDDFNYELPPERIAERPMAERTASRLLVLDRQSGALADAAFRDVRRLLRPGDLLVLNNTRVIPARLFARKPTGGRVEIMLERIEGQGRFLARMKASKALPEGLVLTTDAGSDVTVGPRGEDFWTLETDDALVLFEREGHMPLPPYIQRPDEALDRDRYQTVFAEQAGAVAAPTAGLHFDATLLAELRDLGVRQATVTLHVGMGTYKPVTAERLEDHVMHEERIEVSEELVAAVAQTRARGGRVVAVGTTVMRALESAARTGTLAPFRGPTDLFITPGFPFRVVDALITNFHQPRSTLLVLVSAFASREGIQRAYAHALAGPYRFLSYGDAMFIGSIAFAEAGLTPVAPAALAKGA